MTREDWEHVAWCAKQRFILRLEESRRVEHWLPEWETWMALQMLSGQGPF